MVPDKVQTARVAVNLLLDRMGGEGAGGCSRDVRADYALAARESTVGRS